MIPQNFFQFKQDLLFKKDLQPIFFLSTGRTGTKLFTEIIKEHINIDVYHEPIPELIEESKIAYELYIDNPNNYTLLNKSFSTLIKASRENYLFKSYCNNTTFIETNNRISFFAHSLKYLFPNAKFVFLYRHPGEFVRSGIRRGWYSGQHSHDLGRIVPTKKSIYYTKWQTFTKIQKISWLWYETNKFILNFAKSNPKNVKSLYFNNLDVHNCAELFEWLNITPDINIIKTSLNSKINAQIQGDFPEFKDWINNDKNDMLEIVQDLLEELEIKL